MDDMIQRQAALDALGNIDCSDGVGFSALKFDAIVDAVTAIKALPSAESELENKIRAIGYTGKEGRIYIGGRLFAVRELAQ